MKRQDHQPEHTLTSETNRLVREVEDQAGEDNVLPWLLVHQTLIQAAVSGCKYGLKDAVQRAHEQRN